MTVESRNDCRVTLPGKPGLLAVVERMAALTLALVLLRSSLAHVGSPYHFLSSVLSYDLTGLWLGVAVAAVLPWLQMVLAVSLLAKYRLRHVYLLCGFAFLAFFLAQVSAFLRDRSIACGCFGSDESETINPATIAVPLTCMIASLTGYWGCRGPASGGSLAAGVPDRTRQAFTLLELLVVIAIMSVLTGLMLAGVQKVRAAAARLRCQNNLRQLGLALHSYHGSWGSLPPGCSYHNGLDPLPHMAWLTRLLPYVEQESLWRQALEAYRQDPFFETPPHYPVMGRFLPLFTCPSDPHGGNTIALGPATIGTTSYLGVTGTDHLRNDGVLFLDSAVRLTDIADGTSTTLAVGERPRSPRGDLGWWYAGWGQALNGSADMHLGVRERLVMPAYVPTCPAGLYHYRSGIPTDNCDAFHFWSGHPGGASFLMADGSVRFFPYSSDAVLPALATRSGGEPTTD